MSDSDRLDQAGRLFRRVRQLELLSARWVEGLLSGQYRSVFRGLGIEFDEVREYVNGDDIRLIDWNVSSRFGNLYTKTFREEREMTLALIVDSSASMRVSGEATSDTVATLVALFTFAALTHNDRVGCLFFSDQIEGWTPPGKGRKHGLRIIQDTLSLRPAGDGSDLGKALRTTADALDRRGIVVIISDFLSSGYLRDLSIVSRRHDVIAIRVSSPLQRTFPPSGLLTLEDPETGRTMLAYGRSTRFRKAYRDFWERLRLQWLRECNRRGVRTLEISVDDDPVDSLLRFFRRKRR